MCDSDFDDFMLILMFTVTMTAQLKKKKEKKLQQFYHTALIEDELCFFYFRT